MYRSCRYCGRIHKANYMCPLKPKEIYNRGSTNSNEVVKFRNTQAWRKKSREIKERDLYLCQICIRKIYGNIPHCHTDKVETHHIIKLEDNFDLRLENTNLITLCLIHHKMADRGQIPKEMLKNIAEQQESNPPGS